MLATLSIKTQPLARPESATLPQRCFGNFPTHTNHTNATHVDGIFLSCDKIILPVKEYSNKFLRDKKIKDQVVSSNNIFKNKRPFVYSRKDIKNRKIRQARLFQNKENDSRPIKTQSSLLASSFAQSQQKNQHVQAKKPILQRSMSTPNNNERISTSRALELFSRVFKNETIERMRIRKEIITREMDVKVKQIKLEDKDKAKDKDKDKDREREKLGVAEGKEKDGRYKIADRKRKFGKCYFWKGREEVSTAKEEDDDDYQIAGW